MNIITVINAKGGCGKSTIAMNLSAGLAHLGYRTLLIDMDPQAQVTQWLSRGDGLASENTLVMVMASKQPLSSVIQTTDIANLSFVASAIELEHLGRQITDQEGYHLLFTRALGAITEEFDFVVLDSPNQISPIMENAIFPTDLFIVPFESTKAVKSYLRYIDSGAFAVWNGARAEERDAHPATPIFILPNEERRNNTAEHLLRLKHPKTGARIHGNALLLTTHSEFLADPLGEIYITLDAYRRATAGTAFDPEMHKATARVRTRDRLVAERVEMAALLGGV